MESEPDSLWFDQVSSFELSLAKSESELIIDEVVAVRDAVRWGCAINFHGLRPTVEYTAEPIQVRPLKAH
ncbi:hypothetical protein EVAR_54956_1 [Eumeta japonica]|uniref:Uncharacterized protein n=1 Tax=Eumeta variegata TaxID=151549 RepID=A0A4C1YNP6_EUMVA|nr:hypothetical protein EVAR_54956_1 [Eumeta japonica]